MSHPTDSELRHLAERLGLTALLELDPQAFREAFQSAEILRTATRQSASAWEEPAHVARLDARAERDPRD